MQTIFITGVSSGIGRALAEEYIDRGDVVFGVGRNPAKSIMSNPNFYFVHIDLSDPSLVLSEIRKFISGRFFDLMILNAGIYSHVKNLDETTLDEMQAALNINLLSTKHIIDAVVLYAKVDQIIALSADPSVFGYHGFGAYMISKAAMNSLIQLFAEEYPGIHFNSLALELIHTPALSKFLKIHDPQRHPYVQKIKDGYMMPIDQAIPQLIDAFREARRTTSGSLIEMRKLKKQRIRF